MSSINLDKIKPRYGVRYAHDGSESPGFAHFSSLPDAEDFYALASSGDPGVNYQIVRYSDGEVLT